MSKQFLFSRSWRKQEQKFRKRTESEKKANFNRRQCISKQRGQKSPKMLAMELAGRQREWRTKQSAVKTGKVQNSRCCRLLTTGQERMKTAVWWVIDFIQKKSTLTQASSLKENTKMSEPFQTRWKFTLLPAFQRSKFKWKKRLATVTNAWRVRNSKAVQHVVGKQSLSVSYTGSHDGRLAAIRVNDWAIANMKVPGTPAGQVHWQIDEQPGWRGRGFLHDQRQGKGSGKQFQVSRSKRCL